MEGVCFEHGMKGSIKECT